MNRHPNTTDHEGRRVAGAPIVVGVDGSDASYLAVRWAAEEAALRRRELRVVRGLDLEATRSVVGSYDVLIPSVIERLRLDGAETVLNARQLALEVDPTLQVSTEVSTANPARLLVEASRTAHLIALGASGNRAAGPRFGSTLLAVTRHASGSVAVVRDATTAQATRRADPVVLGVDCSQEGEAAIGAAFEEASLRGADLVAVHVWSDLYFSRFAGAPVAELSEADMDVTESAMVAERLAGWQEKYPDVDVTRRLYLAGPAARLTEWSRSAQLVVVGSRGRGGFAALLLGSTSESLVRHAHCPVLVVHPDNRHESEE